jgi:hypothetical protein
MPSMHIKSSNKCTCKSSKCPRCTKRAATNAPASLLSAIDAKRRAAGKGLL